MWIHNKHVACFFCKKQECCLIMKHGSYFIRCMADLSRVAKLGNYKLLPTSRKQWNIYHAVCKGCHLKARMRGWMDFDIQELEDVPHHHQDLVEGLLSRIEEVHDGPETED